MAMPQRDNTIEELKRLDALLEYAVTHGETEEQSASVRAALSELKRIERVNARIPNLRSNYISGISEGAFAAFPAMELIRVGHGIDDGIDWEKRWIDAGGKLHDGRMIALKTDPVWRAMSDYGVPYPPFQIHNVMGTLDVGRKECVALGSSPPPTKSQIALRKAGVTPKMEISSIIKR